MLRNLKEFYYPGTISEALDILQRFESRAAVLGGGTSLSRTEDAKIEACVDITRMGLDFVKEEKGLLRLGAAATLDTMARSRKLGQFAGGILARAAASQPSRLLRNGMTLGGAIITATPWSDLPPALLALDAQMVIAGKAERVVPAEEFVSDPRYRLLGRTELLTEVRIPKAFSDWKGGHHGFSRTHSDPAMVIASVLLQEAKDGLCSGARIVVGGIVKRATRSTSAEKKLIGKQPSQANFEQAARAAMKGLEVLPDWRASKEYRLQVAEVLIRRTLAAAWSPGEGEAR